MKALNELGISPWPWDARHYTTFKSGADEFDVADRDNNLMARISNRNGHQDTRLIAAAPELYEALREVVDSYVCKGGESFDNGCEGCIDIYGCNVCKWRAALAKASGEEAK